MRIGWGAFVDHRNLVECAAIAEVSRDQPDPVALIEVLPNRHLLGREHPIGKCHDERRARLQHPADIGEGLHRMRQVLDRDGHDRAVELRVIEGQSRARIDIVDDGFGELRVVVHLRLIEPDADHARRSRMRQQMGAPTAHQIEDGAALREQLGIDGADLFDRAVVDVDHEARRHIEEFILGIIEATEKLRFKIGGHIFTTGCRMRRVKSKN